MIARKILMMEKEQRIWMFQLEEDEIVEMHCEPALEDANRQHLLGNIYVGKVKNIVANIGAAFIEIESGVECYYDLSQASNALFTSKIGKNPLCIGDELVVQISKEAVKTKAPTVSSNLSFTGRYAILTTGNKRIGISSKLPKAIREKWKQHLKTLEIEGFGLIIRTNAKDADFQDVFDEIRELQEKYHSLKQTAPSRTCFSCLLKAPPSYITDLKNAYTEGLTEIVIEGQDLYQQIRMYYEKEQPRFLEKLRLYDESQLPLDKLYNTEKVIERALSERVWLKTGGYLIIQYTEALTVIDVNSGKCISKKDPMETYLKINLEAAKEAAKQMRLRNLSGIIIIDFINLDKEEATKTLLRTFRQYLLKDPIQTTLVDITELQLVEVTRKKVRRPFYESVYIGENIEI